MASRSSKIVTPSSEQGYKKFRKNFVKGVFENVDSTKKTKKKKSKSKKSQHEIIGLTPVLPKESEREIRIDRERRGLERAQEEAERLFKGGEEKQTKRKRGR